MTETTADWAAKLEEAAALREEADRLYLQVTVKRKRAAVLEAQANRERETMEAKAPKADPTDRLLAAAALAVQDLESGFLPDRLGIVLGIPATRAMRLLLALESMGSVRREGRGALVRWAAIDQDEKRARDAAKRLGHFTLDELAEAMELTPKGAQWYLELMISREQIEPSVKNGDGPAYDWLKIQPERTITRRPTRMTPEQEAILKEAVPARRGEAVPLTGKADGSTGRPMRDRKRQIRGRRVKKRPQKGHS